MLCPDFFADNGIRRFHRRLRTSERNPKAKQAPLWRERVFVFSDTITR